MNSEIVPPIKRRRGRPRKKNINVTAINKFPTFTPQTSYPAKRKAFDTSPEIEIISLNGIDPKRQRPDDPASQDPSDDQPKRLQPPRRARFTESYGGTADVILVSASESEEDSDSDSDCGPIPSPVLKIRTPEEQEKYDTHIQELRKALGDEEMKLVLLRKLRDSQKSQAKRGETNGSPLPTALAAAAAQRQTVHLKGGMQIQPLPSKQLMNSNKYLVYKKEPKPEVISNSSSSLLRTTSSPSSQFKPIQSSNKSSQQYNKPVKQEVSSSAEQLNSNHLNQYPLLKNLSNQITITPVPAPTSSSNGSSSRQQQQKQQQQQQQIQEQEKNDAETLQQRQAAAKLALRKQLETTLLQIPLPKPPPLKINFFPNANSMEYLCLMGLDFVVDFLTLAKRHPLQKDPLKCAQCSTDFTCAWKWKEVEREGKKVYDAFCEACINSNVRKALKAQHTNNLKSAFLKALQQEKEIDRLTIHTMPKSTPPPKPSSHSSASKPIHSSRDVTPKSSHSSHSGRHSSSGRHPAPAHSSSSSSAFSIPKHGSMALPYIPKSSQHQGSMNHGIPKSSRGDINHAALAQLSKLSPQYQSLLQAQAQQLLAAGVPLHPGVLSLSPFMTPVMQNHHHHGSSRSSKGSSGRDRSRHYPSSERRSPNVPPHASSSWKA